MTSGQRPSALVLTRSIAAHGLATSRCTLPDEPVDAEQWSELIAEVSSHRLAGLLLRAVEAGAMPVTAAQAEDVANRHEYAMRECLELERHLVALLDTLAAHVLDHRVLKGSAVAHLDYADHAERSYGDVDLLARSEQFDDVLAALTGSGHQRRFPQPRAGFDRRFTKAVTLVAPSGLEVDLHRTLAAGPFGLMVDLDDLWVSPEQFELAGRPASALPPERRLLHACFHAALGDPVPRLSALRDIAEMTHGERSRIEWTAVRDLASRWQAEAVVARAVELTWSALCLAESEVSIWAARYEPSRRERRRLVTYTDPDMGYPARSMAAVGAIPRIGDKVRFLVALGWPADRSRSGRGSWSRGARALRQTWRSLRR